MKNAPLNVLDFWAFFLKSIIFQYRKIFYRREMLKYFDFSQKNRFGKNCQSGKLTMQEVVGLVLR